MRHSLLATTALVLVLPAVVQAQEYPSKPIRLTLPSAAGAWSDVATRQVMTKMATLLGQPIIIMNQPRALGKIAIDECVQSDADGYTLCQGNYGHMVAAVASSIAAGEQPVYDPGERLVPVGLIAETQYALVVEKSVPGEFNELLAYAKKNQGQLFFGTHGPSSVLALAILNSALGLSVTGVPYASDGERAAMVDMVAARIHMKVGSVLTVKPFVDSGHFKVIGVFGGEGRSRFFPDVPTFAELGVPEFNLLRSWAGLWAPLGTPPIILWKLNQALGKALEDPALKMPLENNGVILQSGSPEALAALRSGIPALAKIMRENGIRITGG